MTRDTDNEAVVRRLYAAVMSDGDLDLLDELACPEYVGHTTATPATRDLDGFRAFVRTLRSAFPDVEFVVEDTVADGDEVACRFTATGTHQGEFMGVEPTGRAVTVTGIGICRFDRGAIAESWTNWDAHGLLQQLGVEVPGGTY